MLFPIGDDNIERGHRPFFSYAFLAVNLAVFLFQRSLPSETANGLTFMLGAIPRDIAQGEQLYTLFTSLFLHGSWPHLLGNMLFLWIFADNIEAVIGNFRFLWFYLTGGLLAGLAQVGIDPQSALPCIGASGAIAAVMGAYTVLFPHARVRMFFLLFFYIFYVPAWVFLGLWFVQQLSAGFGVLGAQAADVGGIAFWAHIGGFVFGLAAGFYFRKRYHPGAED